MYFYDTNLKKIYFNNVHNQPKCNKTCSLRCRFGNMFLFREVSLRKYVSEGISHPFIYNDLVYKLRIVNAKRISSRRARK